MTISAAHAIARVVRVLKRAKMANGLDATHHNPNQKSAMAEMMTATVLPTTMLLAPLAWSAIKARVAPAAAMVSVLRVCSALMMSVTATPVLKLLAHPIKNA